MKDGIEVYTWSGDEGLPTPPGLLISLGDGSAVECTEEMLARFLYNSDQEATPNGTGFYTRWRYLSDELKTPYLAKARGVLEVAVDSLDDPFEDTLIQQAQEKR